MLAQRILGRTGYKVSEMGLGTWQVGGKWGSGFDDNNAERILHHAIDRGINFIDTADVYENGLSEKAVGRVIKSRSEEIYVATKCGRKISPHINAGYTPAILRKFVEDSLKNMDLERIDLIQIHCPPTEVYYRPEIFEEFGKMIEEGKIAKLGVSVEKVEEALKAIEYDIVDTVQVIYNIFRQRPNELFFERALQKKIGVIVRVPLASGLLSGKYSRSTQFEKGDHRNFNRNGEMFDKGETFSGIPYETGLNIVEELKSEFPNLPIHLLALKWILMNEAVSTVIPGISNPNQLNENLLVNDFPDLTDPQLLFINKLYQQKIKPIVHHLW
jgi:aryl-alcohol dehydrogenase-like predicted oxidoreductase